MNKYIFLGMAAQALITSSLMKSKMIKPSAEQQLITAILLLIIYYLSN